MTTSTAITEKFVELGHGKTRYFEAGTGYPTILIHGAAGGVGSAAVQIAKAAGARVIGTASADHQDFLRSLGVDQSIDYRSQRFEDVVKDVDLVLNTANPETTARSIGVVKKGGTLVSIVGSLDTTNGSKRSARRPTAIRRWGTA